jgi:hypothetical protein
MRERGRVRISAGPRASSRQNLTKMVTRRGISLAVGMGALGDYSGCGATDA